MEQAIPGMALMWNTVGDKFIISVTTAAGEVIYQFRLDRDKVKVLSSQIDQYLIQSNGHLLHLPPGASLA